MYSVGDDLNTPIMYKDLMSSTMGMNPMALGMPGMNGMYPPTYLGGVQAYQQPTSDSFLQIKAQKYNEDKSFAKKVLVVIAGAVALGCIPVFRKSFQKAGGFKQLYKNTLGSVTNGYKNFLNKPVATGKQNFQNGLNKVKNIFNFKNKTTP